MTAEMATSGGRVDPPLVAGEREMLEAWLEWHRGTLLTKCEGLDEAGRKARPVSTSLLSLHGLVRHMAEVERGWFQRVLCRDRTVGTIYEFTPDNEDAELHPLDDADWDADLQVWRDECQRSREEAARRELDDTGLRRGREVSLRWIYLHMIEEYARHNGHADLIREMVDGTTGE
jgi:uncharacterized damage-inducible protein DinB